MLIARAHVLCAWSPQHLAAQLAAVGMGDAHVRGCAGERACASLSERGAWGSLYTNFSSLARCANIDALRQIGVLTYNGVLTLSNGVLACECDLHPSVLTRM